MEYNMFIDDERYPPMDGDVWVIVRTSQQAIDWIASNGYPSFISFDHDLGGDDTSMGLVNWIIEDCLNREINIPFKWYVHSQNPIGRDNINGKLTSFQLHLLAN